MKLALSLSRPFWTFFTISSDVAVLEEMVPSGPLVTWFELMVVFTVASIAWCSSQSSGRARNERPPLYFLAARALVSWLSLTD